MKYQINAQVVVSCWTEVEANSPEEALKIAGRRSLAEAHIDGSYLVDEYWHFTSDGEPTNARVED